MRRWYDHWDVITPIFKFSMGVRTAFYTTNIIESLNASYRRLNRQRSVFPSAQALSKVLCLATFEATKKWTMPIRNWGKSEENWQLCIRTDCLINISIHHRRSDLQTFLHRPLQCTHQEPHTQTVRTAPTKLRSFLNSCCSTARKMC